MLVHGAAGGIGTAAVQLAAAWGARVIAVVSSPDKAEAARRAGAREVVLADGLREAVGELTSGRGVDVVVDPVGGDLAEPALRRLRYGGRFVTVGYASGRIPAIPLNLVLLKGVRVLGFQFLDFVTHEPERHRRDEEELLGLLAGRPLHAHR